MSTLVATLKEAARILAVLATFLGGLRCSCRTMKCNCAAKLYDRTTCLEWPVVAESSPAFTTYTMVVSGFPSIRSIAGGSFEGFPSSLSKIQGGADAPVIPKGATLDVLEIQSNPKLKEIQAGVLNDIYNIKKIVIATNRQLYSINRCFLTKRNAELKELHLIGEPELHNLDFLVGIYLKELHKLIVINSNIQYIKYGTFHSKPKLLHIYFRNVELMHLDYCTWHPFFSRIFYPPGNKTLFMDGNQFKCDCRMLYVRKMNDSRFNTVNNITNITSSNQGSAICGPGSEATALGVSLFMYETSKCPNKETCPDDDEPSCENSQPEDDAPESTALMTDNASFAYPSTPWWTYVAGAAAIAVAAIAVACVVKRRHSHREPRSRNRRLGEKKVDAISSSLSPRESQRDVGEGAPTTPTERRSEKSRGPPVSKRAKRSMSPRRREETPSTLSPSTCDERRKRRVSV